MRITLELRTESVAESHWLAAMPGQLALLSGGEWSVPVSIRAVSATSGSVDDEEAHRRVLGPGYILDDDAEESVAVMVTYGGKTRIASSFLPPADVARMLRLGLEETARMIEQGEE